jgi:hypothetical protein
MYALEIIDERTCEIVASVEVEDLHAGTCAQVVEFIASIFGIRAMVAGMTRI